MAERETLIRKSDLEWEVERARRAYMPSAPCRLTCLYIAENDNDGRQNLSAMLYHFRKPYVLEVRVQLPTLTDNRWYQAYSHNQQSITSKILAGRAF